VGEGEVAVGLHQHQELLEVGVEVEEVL